MTRLELKSIRERYGLSLRDVAYEVQERGLSKSYINSLENGEKVLTKELELKILQAIYKADERRTKGAVNE